MPLPRGHTEETLGISKCRGRLSPRGAEREMVSPPLHFFDGELPMQAPLSTHDPQENRRSRQSTPNNNQPINHLLLDAKRWDRLHRGSQFQAIKEPEEHYAREASDKLAASIANTFNPEITGNLLALVESSQPCRLAPRRYRIATSDRLM